MFYPLTLCALQIVFMIMIMMGETVATDYKLTLTETISPVPILKPARWRTVVSANLSDSGQLPFVLRASTHLFKMIL